MDTIKIKLMCALKIAVHKQGTEQNITLKNKTPDSTATPKFLLASSSSGHMVLNFMWLAFLV